MQIQISKDSTSLTLNFEPEEVEVINWIRENYGDHEFNMHFTAWLTQRRAQMHDTHKEAIFKHLKENPHVMEHVKSSMRK